MNQQESIFYCESVQQLKKIIPNHGISSTVSKEQSLIKVNSILVVDNKPNMLDSVRFFEVCDIDHAKGILYALELNQAKQVLRNEFSKNSGLCIPVIKKYISDEVFHFPFKKNDIFFNDTKIGKLLKNERIYISDGISFPYYNAISFTTIF